MSMHHPLSAINLLCVLSATSCKPTAEVLPVSPLEYPVTTLYAATGLATGLLIALLLCFRNRIWLHTIKHSAGIRNARITCIRQYRKTWTVAENGICLKLYTDRHRKRLDVLLAFAFPPTTPDGITTAVLYRFHQWRKQQSAPVQITSRWSPEDHVLTVTVQYLRRKATRKRLRSLHAFVQKLRSQIETDCQDTSRPLWRLHKVP